MGLSEYRKKRDFSRTPEPSPAPPARSAPHVFVVQKHAATHTHYDLRLGVGDVLRSWAVPKGPSLDPREKRLAVEVEDHPLEYADFEGVIPEGQYGAGTMMIWDRGRWVPESDAAAALREGMLKFRLEGARLRGRWMLVRTQTGERQPHWLLIKERDAEANPAVGAETFATSVATGRTMDEIAAGAPARAAPEADPAPHAATLRSARPAPVPASLRPQLAVAADAAPGGPDWLHEVKFDGYRLLIFKAGDSVRILSRNGLDWTAKLPDLAAAVRDRVSIDAVIDGEAVMLDTRGVSDFQALQNAIHTRRSRSIVFFAFDLPWCDGFDLTRSPLEARRALLQHLIGNAQQGRLRFSEHVEGNGPLALERVRVHGLEGIVSKRKGSPYTPSRTPAWLKVKCFNQQEFVVAGYTAPEGTRDELGALLVGYYTNAGGLRFAGKVGTGFSAETLRRLGTLLRARVRPTPAFVNPPTGAEARGVTWTNPDLVAQIQFRDWTGEGIIRHPSFRGLREDRDPKSVTREQASSPAPPASAPPPPAAPRPPPPRGRLTNPDRVVFPDRGGGYTVTKQQLAAYYETIGPLMLPHVAGRPLAILRCPEGEGGNSFFQKHPAKGMPAAIRSVGVADDEGTVTKHLLVEDLDGLLGLVQMNAVEFHPWGALAADPEHPDRLIFDLDPGADVTWRTLVEGAVVLRDALAQVGLTAFARTTGGKGLHLVVPIRPVHTWDKVKVFSKAVADTLVRLAPRRFVAQAALERRAGRVYIDYLRNARGASAIASYSVRARPGAPVATPVGWDELPGLPGGASFNVLSVPRRLGSRPTDPWAEIAQREGELP